MTIRTPPRRPRCGLWRLFPTRSGLTTAVAVLIGFFLVLVWRESSFEKKVKAVSWPAPVIVKSDPGVEEDLGKRRRSISSLAVLEDDVNLAVVNLKIQHFGDVLLSGDVAISNWRDRQRDNILREQISLISNGSGCHKSGTGLVWAKIDGPSLGAAPRTCHSVNLENFHLQVISPPSHLICPFCIYLAVLYLCYQYVQKRCTRNGIIK